MAYNVIWARDSRTDILEIVTYLQKDSPTITTKIYDNLLSKCESLIDFPFRGVRRNEIANGGYMILEGSYYIYYQVIDTSVNILRILHQSRNVHNMAE